MNSSEADPGRLLVNRYRLDEVIGAGGMGRVWQGTDTLLDRPVAVKELTTPPNLPAHEVEVLRTRMLREARSAAQLSHPAIITVFDVAEEDGRPWIVMELVRGPSLGDLIRDDGALPVRRAADIGEQMAAGLAEAHARGIVHRDIKPGNVLIAGNDRAVLTDFGIAHLDGATHLTSTGLLIGIPELPGPGGRARERGHPGLGHVGPGRHPLPGGGGHAAVRPADPDGDADRDRHPGPAGGAQRRSAAPGPGGPVREAPAGPAVGRRGALPPT